MKKRIVTFAMAVALMLSNTIVTCAAENATVTFTEKQKLEYSSVAYYDDGTPKLGTSFEGIAPGETAEQVITIKNESKQTADFYLNASVLQALEESTAQARGAGYVIKLTVGDTVLYDSNVGGYAGEGAEGSKEGILEMNDGELEGYVMIATLAEKEETDVTMSIFFDGEAMDNDSQAVDYSNTFGQLGFSFQVSYDEPEEPTVIYNEVPKKEETKYVTKLVEIIEERVPLAGVVTGDNAAIGIGIVVLLTGVVIVLAAGRKKKEEQ